jgi:gliding motility-associated protein GldL
MSSNKSVFESKRWKSTMGFIYGIGAAVVIVGALFKITHWPGADLMLIVGLLTEAAIFLISAFEPVHMDLDWTLAYPELAGMETKEKKVEKKATGSISQQLDKMLEEAKVSPELISSLGTGLKSLGDNVAGMADVTSAATVTNEYTASMKQATSSVSQINDSYQRAIEAVNGLASASTNSTEYAKQMDAITKNLASLNQVYEMEIAESNNHLKTINSFVTNLSGVVTSLQETESQAKSISGEIGSLSKNLASLNTVYGNMLAAMNVSRN